MEAYELDALREPRLCEASQRAVEDLQDETRCLILAGPHPCIFLKENQCSIYPTRPNVCVAFEPGSEECMAARLDDRSGS